MTDTAATPPTAEESLAEIAHNLVQIDDHLHEIAEGLKKALEHWQTQTA